MFIAALKNEIYKYINSISRNVCIDKLDDIVNKCNNTYHRAFKIKPAHVTSSTYIDFNKENNKEGPKFKVADHIRISKYKNAFAKVYVPNWSEVFSVIKNIDTTVTWTYVINDLNGQEIVVMFYKRN